MLKFILIPAALLFVAAAANAESAPLNDCDRFAAQKWGDADKHSDTPGVEFEKIELKHAIPACEAAVAEFPLEKRFQYQLGRAYHAAKNYEKAVAVFNELALKRHGAGIYALANLHKKGEGAPKNLEEGLRLTKEAISIGHTLAYYTLSEFYYKGHVVPKEPDKAFQFLVIAAETGHPAPMYALARLYYTGTGVERDFGKARELFQKTADMGFAEGFVSLAEMTMNGQGFPASRHENERLLLKSVELGRIQSYVDLSEIFQRGPLETRDQAKTIKYLRLGVERGDPASMLRMSQYVVAEGAPNPEDEFARLVVDAYLKGDDDIKNKALYLITIASADPICGTRGCADIDEETATRKKNFNAALIVRLRQEKLYDGAISDAATEEFVLWLNKLATNVQARLKKNR